MTSAPGAARIGSAIFAVSALTLFSVSATLHRGRWGLGANQLLTRLDHASIFLLVAGTYAVLPAAAGRQSAGPPAVRRVWRRIPGGDVPRHLDRRTALALHPALHRLGWASIFFVHDFLARGGVTVVALIAAGGLLYTLGGVVHGLRRPNPFPSWFGFHEAFHASTVVAFAAHYAGVSVLTHTLR